jgi:hypothetical protein
MIASQRPSRQKALLWLQLGHLHQRRRLSKRVAQVLQDQVLWCSSAESVRQVTCQESSSRTKEPTSVDPEFKS